MQTTELSRDEQQLLDDFNNSIATLKSATDGRLKALETAIHQIKQRAALPPAGGAPETLYAAEPLLMDTAEFKSWLSGARSRKASCAVELPFTMKAANPVLGAGGVMPTRAVYGPQQPATRLATLIPEVPIRAGASVQVTQETSFAPGAGVVPEGTLKPETAIQFSNVVIEFQTIATVLKASVQSLADVPSLGQWLDMRLRQAVLLKAEDVLLNAAAPAGLLAVASTLDPAFAPGTGATQLDYVAAAIGQLEALGYSVDGVVLPGPDASKMRLLKSTTGEFLWAQPDAAVGVKAVWGVPVVVSPKLASGRFLVGAFAQSTALFSRQALTVEIAYENEDDFTHNLACLRAEERIALGIAAPSGLVTGTFPAE